MSDAVDALYRRALDSCERGRIEYGIELVREALALAPGDARCHRLLGIALLRTGHGTEALASLDRAVALDPASAEAFGARADALAALGRMEEAVESYRRALMIRPNSVQDWCNQGAALLDLARHREAVESFDHAIALAPEFAPAHYNLGNALSALSRFEAAIASFDRALALDPTFADAHNNKANALERLGLQTEALAAVERAIAADPSHRAARVTRAIVLRKLGRPEEALADCDCVLSVAPDDASALTVRGDALIDLERFEEALTAFDRLIALDPASATARWNRGFIRLSLGRLEEGWLDYEHRWAGAQGLVPRAYPQPRWQGGPIDGTLLVWGEQGLGDEILHASMIPDVMRRTGAIALEVEPRLVPLFARSFAGITVLPAQPALHPGPFAAQIAIGSLGQHFRRRWEDFPSRGRGHLVADAGRSAALRARLALAGRRIIGLSWISKAPIGGAQKSARLADFAPLLRLPDCRFVDLQYGDTAAERAAVERELGVRVERLADIDNTNDLDGLAALMCACDAVVTVSNTTAHLAGALGRPTWVMVPSGQARIWYWFRDRAESPWYPRVQVRRQRRGQPWAELAGAVAGELCHTGL